MMELKANLKSTTNLRLEQESKQLEAVCTGCSVMEYTFHNVVRAEVGEIRFRNHYVALLTIKVRFKACAAAETRAMRGGSGGSNANRWRTALRAKQLMPNAHLETGGQDFVVLREKDFRVPLKDVAVVRLVLQQPSPMWKDFHLDDVTFWRSSSAVNEANVAALRHLASLGRPQASDEKVAEEVTEAGDCEAHEPSLKHPRSQTVASKLQQLWAMSAWCQSNAPVARVGNYEKEGSYEGSLLAYS